MCVSGLILYFGAYLLMRIFSPVRLWWSWGDRCCGSWRCRSRFFGLMVVLEGIFYGLGRTRYAFLVETVGMWGVRILFTFLCVRYCIWDCRRYGTV